jgi:hypothetical protein
MAELLQEKERRVLSCTGKVTSYIYDKNRRFPVDAGTKAVSVLVLYRGPDNRRRPVQSRAIEVAIQEWEERWGKFPWDLGVIVVHHFTIQIMVEVRVEPR